MQAIKKLLEDAGIDDRWTIDGNDILVGEYTDCDSVRESQEHAYTQIDSVGDDLEKHGYTIQTDDVEHDYVGYRLRAVRRLCV